MQERFTLHYLFIKSKKYTPNSFTSSQMEMANSFTSSQMEMGLFSVFKHVYFCAWNKIFENT